MLTPSGAFVARFNMRGGRWGLFLPNSSRPGEWYVTSHATKRDAMEGFAKPRTNGTKSRMYRVETRDERVVTKSHDYNEVRKAAQKIAERDGIAYIRHPDGTYSQLEATGTRQNPAPEGFADRSTYATVVTYALQDMQKGKSPAAAAKSTAKKLSGSPNMMIGSPVDPIYIDPKVLEEALWAALVAQVNEWGAGMRKPWAWDPAESLSNWNQKPAVIAEVIRRRDTRTNVGMLQPGSGGIRTAGMRESQARARGHQTYDQALEHVGRARRAWENELQAVAELNARLDSEEVAQRRAELEAEGSSPGSRADATMPLPMKVLHETPPIRYNYRRRR